MAKSLSPPHGKNGAIGTYCVPLTGASTADITYCLLDDAFIEMSITKINGKFNGYAIIKAEVNSDKIPRK